MAVYEHVWRPYEGPLTPGRARFLVIPRDAWRRAVGSRAFIFFAAICLVGPASAAVLIYLRHNLLALSALNISASLFATSLPIDGRFFSIVLSAQGFLAFLLALFEGPSLIAPDLANNGLALYFSRPLTRWEYVLGKFCALAAIMSFITWVPVMLLFVFQAALEGGPWLSANGRFGISILLASWIWIVLLALMTMTASAWVKRKPLAAALVLAFFFVSRGMAGALNLVYGTWLGDLINVPGLTATVQARLFGLEPPTEVPIALAWGALLAFCALCLWLLARKVRAYEVVR